MLLTVWISLAGKETNELALTPATPGTPPILGALKLAKSGCADVPGKASDVCFLLWDSI